MSDRPTVPPIVACMRLVTGYQVSRAIQVAVSLGVFDRLAQARTSAEVAADVGADADALHRLMRVLAGVDVLREEDDGRFSLTAIGTCLRSDLPHSMSAFVKATGEPYYWRAWEELLSAVKTGDNAFRTAHGVDAWTYREQRPQIADEFNRAMSAMAVQLARAVVMAYDFRRFRRVVDIGGGEGALLSAILSRSPDASGVLFDLPAAVANAARHLPARVAPRCEIVGGSFFDAVPGGGDAYLLSSVLHNWDDEHCGKILARCRAVASPESRLFVIEAEIGRAAEAPDRNLLDLNMMVVHGSRERSHADFEALLGQAGFSIIGTTPTIAGKTVIEAQPR